MNILTAPTDNPIYLIHIKIATKSIRKSFLIILHILVVTQTLSQTNYLTFPLDIKQSGYVIREALPVVNSANGDLAIFFGEGRTIYSYLFNKNKENIGKLYNEELPNSIKNFLGSSIDENGKTYCVYSSNANRTRFYRTIANFDNNKVSTEEFDLDSDMEIFVESFSQDGNFLLLSLHKKVPEFYIYQFNGISKAKKHTIDLSQTKIIDKKGKEKSLFKIFRSFEFNDIQNGLVPKAKTKLLSFEVIEPNLPTTLQQARYNTKIYLIDDRLYISIDENSDYTQLITFYLKTADWDFRLFQKPLDNTPAKEKNSNSYIFNDLLFTISNNKNAIVFRCIELESKKLVSESIITRNSDITIIKERSSFLDFLNMNIEDTNQLIDFMDGLKSAISVYDFGGYYEFRFGGSNSDEIRESNIYYFEMDGDSPAMTNFLYYQRGSISELKGYLNEDFEHVKPDRTDNVFDLILNYKKDQRYRLDAETLFHYGDQLIWGGYDRKLSSYVLKSFKD